MLLLLALVSFAFAQQCNHTQCDTYIEICTALCNQTDEINGCPCAEAEACLDAFLQWPQCMSCFKGCHVETDNDCDGSSATTVCYQCGAIIYEDWCTCEGGPCTQRDRCEICCQPGQSVHTGCDSVSGKATCKCF